MIIPLQLNCFFFFQVLNEKQHDLASRAEYNFDHPDAFDFDLLIPTLKRLKEGKKVDVPIYNFVTHCRENKTVRNIHNYFYSIYLCII